MIPINCFRCKRDIDLKQDSYLKCYEWGVHINTLCYDCYELLRLGGSAITPQNVAANIIEMVEWGKKMGYFKKDEN